MNRITVYNGPVEGARKDYFSRDASNCGGAETFDEALEYMNEQWNLAETGQIFLLIQYDTDDIDEPSFLPKRLKARVVAGRPQRPVFSFVD